MDIILRLKAIENIGRSRILQGSYGLADLEDILDSIKNLRLDIEQEKS